MNRGPAHRALLLPLTVIVLIPSALLQVFGGGLVARLSDSELALGPGSALLAVGGLLLMVRTITLLHRIGKGTLAPWNPTTRLVVAGIYRHVRNPMITGVICLLGAEALFFESWLLAGWATFFALLNGVWVPMKEELDLVTRFGDDYEEYRRHVPRWIPRLTAWTPPWDAPDA